MAYFERSKYLLQFLLSSKTIYRAHSPFLFELIENCFHKKPSNKLLDKINILRKRMRTSDQNIWVTDFGTSKNRKRKVKHIAKSSLTSKKRSEIIHQIIKRYNCCNVIELGTNLGINTIYMALANKNANVQTIEGCHNIHRIAKSNFESFNLTNVQITNDTFEATLPKILQSIKTFDFIYIDGNHTYEATMKYFDLCLKYRHNNSIILFDDIHWSKGMQKAWQDIIKSKEVSLSVNYFYSGLVFFKKELSKENFKLRYKNFFKTR